MSDDGRPVTTKLHAARILGMSRGAFHQAWKHPDNTLRRAWWRDEEAVGVAHHRRAHAARRRVHPARSHFATRRTPRPAGAGSRVDQGDLNGGRWWARHRPTTVLATPTLTVRPA